MEPGDWIAGLALGLGLATLGIEIVRIRREGARHAANERRLDAAEERVASQESALLLIELRQRLEQLHDAALAHLAPTGGNDATDSALRTRIDDATFWSDRAKSHEVRAEAFVFVKAATVARNVGPHDPEPHREKARQAVRDTMRDASKAIGARLDELQQ